jgi:hypothetical protein
MTTFSLQRREAYRKTQEPYARLCGAQEEIVEYKRSGVEQFTAFSAILAEWNRAHGDFEAAPQEYCNTLGEVTACPPADNINHSLPKRVRR